MIMSTSKKRASLLVFLPALLMSLLVYGGDLQQGRAFYQNGVAIDGATITIAGGIQADVKNFPCQSCHQPGGKGGFEGGVAVPSITWRSLAVRRPTKQFTAYNETLLKRALSAGIDSEGKPLHALMPRYNLSDTDFENLLSYLKSLDHAATPGVSDHSLRIGVILSADRQLLDVTSLIRKILHAYFRELNDNGGIHGRTVQLVFTVPEDLPEDVFCYLGGIIKPAELEGINRSINPEIPVLFPLGQLPQSTDSIAFLAGFSDQLASLSTFMNNAGHTDEEITLVADAKDIASLRERLEDSIPPSNRISVVQITADGFAQQPLENMSGHIFWFSRHYSFAKFVAGLKNSSLNTSIYSSIDLAGGSLARLPATANTVQLILSNPRGVPVPDSAEYKNFTRFQHENSLPITHAEWQRTAWLSATLLAHTLKQSGRRINRQILLQSASAIHKLPVGVMPPVSTSGTLAKPSQILRFNPESRSLVSLQAWLAGQNQ